MSVNHDTPVYSSATPGAKPAVVLKAGEPILLGDEAGDFRRVKIKLKGKWRVGYVARSDVEVVSKADAERPKRKWGVGLGGAYDHLSQTGRNFQTEDQVQWTTSAYVSQQLVPYVNLQLYEQNFWRLSLGYKTTHYMALAVTNSGGGGTKPIEINHKMISLLLQKAFNPLPWKFVYAGAGLGVSKATSVDVTLDGKRLSTSDQEKSTYVGVQGFAGLQFFLLKNLSLAGEGRLSIVPNQVPIIYEYEFAGCLIYWL